ncbi:uncharacterized protein [Ptychodera flava]|uniref:uncharacterized protein n=1 Tax=Ptychodera flava TaxID=63121 RepID=UPI00396A0C2F
MQKLHFSTVCLFMVFFAIAKCWPNTCQLSSQQHRSVSYLHTVSTRSWYYVSCGFLWLSRCTKYRMGYKYQKSYKLQYYTTYYIGNCTGYCSSYLCHGCTTIDHCIDIRCTSNEDQHCLKCEYDRGGQKKAYVLVEDQGIENRKCEQRCSWRPDSKFCYPGSCPGHPSNCSCVDGFSGDNCLSITEKPNIGKCSGKITATGSDDTCDFGCGDNNVEYCRLNASSFHVDWTSRYKPSLDSIVKPYYVNDIGFGIVSAALIWNLTHDNVSLVKGTSSCLADGTGIINITADDLAERSCSHVIDLHTDVEHNTRLSVKLSARNGGFIKLNNFDAENSTTIDDPTFYNGISEEKTPVIVFDFLPPLHTVCGNVTDCSANIMNIGDSYTTKADITIRWLSTDWIDEPSGIDHYDCEAFQLTHDTTENDLLDMRSSAPRVSKRNIHPSNTETTLHLPDPGVYAIILTVYDRAKNFAKVRRFVMFDDFSAISIDVTKSIKAKEEVYNKGVYWVNPSKSKTLLSWDGHFCNPFHRDELLLNGIAELKELPRVYDEITGQPPTSRSREAIHNADGIVRFQIYYALSDWTELQNWTDIRDVETEFSIPIPDSKSEFMMVWLRAYDVMNHTKEDSVILYFDKTPPDIYEMEYIHRCETNAVQKQSNPGLKVRAEDKESGILEVRWKLLGRKDHNLVYSEGTRNDTSPSEPWNKVCSPTFCTCIKTLGICSFLEYRIVFDISAFEKSPTDQTHCTVVITVVNNANLSREIEKEIEIDTPKS